MTDGFLNLDSSGIARRVGLSWTRHSDHADGAPSGHLRTAIGWLPIAVIFAAAAALLLAYLVRSPRSAAHLSAAVSAKPATTVGLAEENVFDPATSEAIVPAQPAPVDRLKIASQSWRRGGLGSNALVTMTLRNDNSYSVKNVDISCTFLRPDGSYLTSRSRTIPDVINMKSRKTLARLHIGFVNANAAKAKCLLVAANRA